MIINKILSHCLPTILQSGRSIDTFFIFGFPAFKTEKKTFAFFVKSFVFAKITFESFSSRNFLPLKYFDLKNVQFCSITDTQKTVNKVSQKNSKRQNINK